MNRQRLKLVIAPLLAAGLVGFIYFSLVPRCTPDRFHSQIAADLPIGTERNKVEAWLKARGLSFRDTYTMDGRKRGLYGEFRKYYIDYIGKTTIQFSFSFDEKDKLTEFSVGEFHLFF